MGAVYSVMVTDEFMAILGGLFVSIFSHRFKTKQRLRISTQRIFRLANVLNAAVAAMCSSHIPLVQQFRIAKSFLKIKAHVA